MSKSAASGVPVLSWFDEPVKSSIKSVFEGLNSTVESLDLFRRYRGTHFAMLREVVGWVKILGMSNPLSLADLYYPTIVSSDIKRRLYNSDWVPESQFGAVKKGVPERIRPADGSSHIEKCKRLIVLGGPGAGKTTFLKFMTLAFSDKSIFLSTELKTSKLPFFVSLPELCKTELSVFDFISKPLITREGMHAEAFIDRVLKKGLSIVLFDSLDEVPRGQRAAIVQRIRDFYNIYSECKIVISCRTADYVEFLDSFHEVEILKLKKDAVHKIIRSWFREDAERAEKLISVIEADPSISNLTETPLLLGLLCVQFRHDLALPRRKVEVYRRCVETLLRDWDTTRGFRRDTAYEALSDLQKERLFEHLAGGITQDENIYVFRDDAVTNLAAEYISRLGISAEEAKEVIEEVERHHGILERHSVDSFCFSHSSIQDYFVAKNALSRRLELEIVKRRLEDESWSQVIEFLCGLHVEPDEIFDSMMKRAVLKDLKNYPAIERRAKLVHLVYRCLSVGPALSPMKTLDVAKHILESLQGFVTLMGKSGVHPLCRFTGGAGVRHAYFYFGQKRQSLDAALLPYRKLSNEIFSRPVPIYAKLAFDSAEKIVESGKLDISTCAILLNTVVPLASADPARVSRMLRRMKEILGPNHVINRIADEALVNL